MVKQLLCCGLLAMMACAYTNAGQGTNTLQANLALSYVATTDDVLHVSGQLTKNSLAVNDAHITLMDTDTNETFVLGRSGGDVPGYRAHLQVKVGTRQDEDQFSCSIEAPTPHTLLTPLQNATQALADDLHISWQTSDGLTADEVEVRLSLANVQVTLPRDLGHYTISHAHLKPGIETITVTRRNSVVPKGAAGSSLVQVQYSGAVSFTVR